ncbi:hypothetical protein Thaha01_01825 [Tetragenococcus halophilus subsp. halophilus]
MGLFSICVVDAVHYNQQKEDYNGQEKSKKCTEFHNI